MKKLLPIIIIVLVILGFGVAWKLEAPTLPNPNPNRNPNPIVEGGCFIGGCSNQICSDQKDMVSTCEYREEYACYKTAKCERQASGECGWIQTQELSACLNASKNNGTR